MKLRQYELGKAFCDEVVAEAGIEALNRVWSGPTPSPPRTARGSGRWTAPERVSAYDSLTAIFKRSSRALSQRPL